MPRPDDPPNPAITRFMFDQWVHRVASVHNTTELDRRLSQENARIFLNLSRLSNTQPVWIVPNQQRGTFRASERLDGHESGTAIRNSIAYGTPFVTIRRDSNTSSLTVQVNPNAEGIHFALSPIFTLHPADDTIIGDVNSTKPAEDIPVTLDSICMLQFGKSQTQLTIVLFSPQTLSSFGAQNITEPLIFIASSQMQPNAQLA